MTLQIEFWHLVSLVASILLSVVGCVIGMARWLAAEYDARQEQRMKAFEDAARAGAVAHAEALRQHVAESDAGLDRIDAHGDRLARLEAAVAGNPTHRDVAALYESINQLGATVNQLVGDTRLLGDLMRMLINREVAANNAHRPER